MSHFDFLICTLETCVLTSEFYALMQYARKKKKEKVIMKDYISSTHQLVVSSVLLTS